MFESIQSDIGSKGGAQFIIARVKKIVLGKMYSDTEENPDYSSEKDLGMIYYEPLYSGKSNIFKGAPISKPAYPIFPFIRQYPNIHEIVMIITGPSSTLNDGIENQDSWYFPPFGIFNSVHTNIFPNLEEWRNYCLANIGKPGYDLKGIEYLTMPQGKTFIEKHTIKTLRPFEGDTILQGRWGQSFRMGSTVSNLKSINKWSNYGPTGDPITMIVNSQKRFTAPEQSSPTTTEDINRDGSSIYLTSTQAIAIDDIKLYKIRSYTYSTAVSPITSTVIIPEMIPISNEFVSATEQDSKSNS